MFFTKKYWNDVEIEEMGQKTTLYIRNENRAVIVF